MPSRILQKAGDNAASVEMCTAAQHRSGHLAWLFLRACAHHHRHLDNRSAIDHIAPSLGDDDLLILLHQSEKRESRDSKEARMWLLLCTETNVFVYTNH